MRGLAVVLAMASVWVLVATAAAQRQPRSLDSRQLVHGLGSGIAGFIVGLLATGAAFPALGLGTIASALPSVGAAALEARTKQKAATAWPDALAVVRAKLGSGTSIRDAFTSAVRESEELGRWGHELTGPDFESSLQALGAAVDDPLTDRVVATIAVAHRVGGPRVGSIIGGLAESVADEVRVREAHAAAITEQRLTALVALVAPWALLVLTAATNEQARDLYASSTGGVVIGIGVAATIAGYIITQRTLRLARMPRTFQ